MATRRKLIDPEAIHAECNSAMRRDRSDPRDPEAAKPLTFRGSTLQMIGSMIVSSLAHVAKRTASALQEIETRQESSDQLLIDALTRIEALEMQLRERAKLRQVS